MDGGGWRSVVFGAALLCHLSDANIKSGNRSGAGALGDVEMITTHILDLESGAPAAGVAVVLTGPEALQMKAVTDEDGRVTSWDAPFDLYPGSYQMEFLVGAYFARRGAPTFFESIPVRFVVEDIHRAFHVPLLLSPFGYSTYRGS